MESNRQTLGKALLSLFAAFVIGGVSLLAASHVGFGVALVVVGCAALAVALRILFRRPKPLVVPPEVSRAFARAGSIMGKPPRYDSTLRKRL
jgi:hypothetical protein